MLFPLLLATAIALQPVTAPQATSLQPINTDPLNNPTSMHRTEVGAVIGSNGSVEVSSMLVGRNYGDAAPAMGLSVLTPFGVASGLLPGLTKNQTPAGPYDAVTFPSVAWNSAYRTWLISVLPITGDPNGNDTTHAPVVLRSGDGLHWTTPQPIAPDVARPEKNLLTCDNNFGSSRYFGNCYVVWDDNDNNDLFHANVSNDGGRTWATTQNAADNHSAYGAFPVVQPNGTVVVSSEDYSGYDGEAANLISFVSTNGGKTWSGAGEIAQLQAHQVAANMRTQALPSSAVASNGTIYTVWQDCRFRANCSANDIVLTTSTDGTAWTAPARIPLDPVTSGVDHFLPSISIQSHGFFAPSIALTYYYFAQANCAVATCLLYAATSISNNGGATWSSPTQLAGPMNVAWLPLTSAGYMVGDYFTSVLTPNGLYAPLDVAAAPNGSTYNEATYLPVSCFFRCNSAATPATGERRVMSAGRLQRARPAPRMHRQTKRSPL